MAHQRFFVRGQALTLIFSPSFRTASRLVEELWNVLESPASVVSHRRQDTAEARGMFGEPRASACRDWERRFARSVIAESGNYRIAIRSVGLNEIKGRTSTRRG